MTRGRPLIALFLAYAAALFTPGRADAFERQWHAGAGLGVTAYPHHYSAGPALGLNAAYGISDVFDLKLELLASRNTLNTVAGRQSAMPYSAAAGLSYKVDVLQWIPYGALLVGYQHIQGTTPLAFKQDDALAVLVIGLDYALSREWGLGASLRTDFLLTSPEIGGAFTTFLRAEYHWGF